MGLSPMHFPLCTSFRTINLIRSPPYSPSSLNSSLKTCFRLLFRHNPLPSTHPHCPLTLIHLLATQSIFLDPNLSPPFLGKFFVMLILAHVSSLKKTSADMPSPPLKKASADMPSPPTHSDFSLNSHRNPNCSSCCYYYTGLLVSVPCVALISKTKIWPRHPIAPRYGKVQPPL
jgi:hypothetical protein